MTFPIEMIVPPYEEIDFTRMTFDSRVTFTRSSSASRFKQDGTIEVVGSNVPRIDYAPATGECLGLLIEGAITNLLLNSTTLSTQTVTTTATTYTLSFYGTGSITLSGTATGTLNSAGAWPARAVMTFTPTAGALTLTVSGSVQYAQLEAYGVASSWIPTTGSAVARASDVAKITNASWGKQVPYDGWTVWADFTTPSMTSGYNRSITCRKTSTGLTDVWWMFLAQNGNINPRPVQFEGLGSAFNITASNVSAGQRVKVAGTMQNVNRRGSVNGGAVQTRGTSGTLPSNLPDLIEIGAGNGGISHLSRFRRIRFYPWLLSNAELQGITA